MRYGLFYWNDYRQEWELFDWYEDLLEAKRDYKRGLNDDPHTRHIIMNMVEDSDEA